MSASLFWSWERVNDRRVQLARRAWQALWRFDPQPPDELVREFACGYHEADPVAEAFVDEVYLKRGAREGPRRARLPRPDRLHPLARFPVVLTLERFRRLLPPLDSAADRVQRWRRNNWYANETGGREAELHPVEEFRR